MSQIFEEIMPAPDGPFYGREWKRDAFDRCVDDLLHRKYKHALPNPNVPRVALDIGCYTGQRASLLASSGFFKEVIACDINNCSDWISKRNQKSLVPIHFRQMNALELEPESFAGKRVSYVNFRRVGHFLPLHDFRLALNNISNIVSNNGLVSVSFDDKKATDTNLHPQLAPYWRHDGDEIKSYMEELGFTVQSVEGQNTSDGENEERESGLNQSATHLIAFAPTHKKEFAIRPETAANSSVHIAQL